MRFGRALVTGGAGFIGSHIAARLIEEGCEVRVLDDFSTGSLRNLTRERRRGKLSVVRGDICDREVAKKAMKDVEVVFHEAAIVSVQKSIEEPDATNRVNVEGSLNLLEAAVDAGVDRFVFASSAAVYGKSKTLPITERAPPAPISPYGRGKLRTEEYCLEYHFRFGLPTTVLRYFNVYGPGSSSGDYSGVITRFAQKLARGERMTIYGSGKQSRDFVYVEDVVSANILAASSARAVGEGFNVGSGTPITISELARLEASLFSGSERLPPIDHRPAKAGDIDRSYADISKIRRLLGFEPRLSLKEGLSEFLRWFRRIDAGSSTSR